MIGYVQRDGGDYLRGYKTVAAREGIACEVLTADQLCDLGALGRHDAVIIATGIGGSVGLPRPAGDTLREYMQLGGAVILEQSALLNVINLPIKKSTAAKTDRLTITTAEHPITAGFRAGQTVSYGAAARRITLTEPEAVTVLGQIGDEPGLVVATVGRGQLIYSSLCLSWIAPEYPEGVHWRLLRQIMRYALAYEPGANPDADHGAAAALVQRWLYELDRRVRGVTAAGAEIPPPDRKRVDQARRKLADAARDLAPPTNVASLCRTAAASQRASRSLADLLARHLRTRSRPVPKDLCGMRVVSMTYPPDLTPAGADGIAADLYDVGVNLVLTEHYRQHMSPATRTGTGPPTGRSAAVGLTATRLLTDACRRFGIRVVHHSTCIFIRDMPEQWQAWSQRDVRTGEPTMWARKWNLFCLNNPEFRREYFARMKRFRDSTGVDGLMVDEVEWLPNRFACGCDTCRTRFRRETGFQLSTGKSSPHWDNYDDPLWRAWITARMRWVGDFYEDFQRQVLSDEHVWFGCLAGGAEIHMPVQWGDELEEFLRSHNIVFFESYVPHHFHMWLADAPRMAYHTGAGASYRLPVLTLLYPLYDTDFAYGWAYVRTFGHRQWIQRGYYTLTNPTWERYYDFDRQHAALYRRPQSRADTAVLFSRRTRDLYFPNQRDRFLTEWRGWCQALQAANRPYDVILDRDICAGRLGRYKLLILPACACMSVAQAEALKAFVNRGGTLVIAGEAGIRDETGEKRPASVLDTLAGTPLLAPARRDYRLSPTGARDLGAAPAGQVNGLLMGMSQPETGRTLVTATGTDGRSQPFVVERPVGAGRVFMVAGHIGALADLPRVLGRHKEPVTYHDPRVPGAQDLTARIIEAAHPGPWPLAAPAVDDSGVLVTAFAHSLAPDVGAVVLHALNVSGTRLEEGQAFTSEIDDVSYPATEPFEVKLLSPAAAARVYAVSPEYAPSTLDKGAGQFPGRPLPFANRDGVVSLTIPRLGTYCTVVVELGRR